MTALNQQTRRLKRASLMLVDQVLSSATNYAVAFIGALVLLPVEFAEFVISFGIITIAIVAVRAVVGEPAIAVLPVESARGDQARLLASALATAFALGAITGTLGIVVGVALNMSSLVALSTFFPFVALADATRFCFFARRAAFQAVLVDGVWAITQAAIVAVSIVVGGQGLYAVASSWGLGAVAGSAIGVYELRGSLARPAFSLWWTATRRLSGWFSLTSVLGQSQMYVVLFLAGFVLTPFDVAGLRSIQLLALQPPVTITTAILSMLIPSFVGLVANEHWGTLRKYWRWSVGAMLVLSLALLVLPLFARPIVTGLLPLYDGYSYLVLPFVINAGFFAVAVPCQAALRAMHNGPLLFRLQIVIFACIVGGSSAGLVLGSLTGLAWGAAAGTAVSTVVGLYLTWSQLCAQPTMYSAASSGVDR